MTRDPSPLCCCEYVNIRGERDHILACCCNCNELDACVDNVICCRRKGKRGRFLTVFVEFQDKMRIPWNGGARNVAVDKILPTVLVVLLFILAAQGWMYMTFTFFFLILFITLPREKYFCLTLDTHFHARALYSCIASILIIYELYVIPQLKISFIENMIFVIFMTITGLAFYAVQVNRGNHSIDGPLMSRECQACHKPSHFTDFHSVWYGCCIGRHNRKWYVLSLGSLTAALFTCSYLTLTTICRPYELVEGLILIPEDCSDTFIQWQYSICFVSGVFSLVFSEVLFALTFRELWFISNGFTVTEWRNLPTSQKLCLGLYSERPHDRGFFVNWSEILKP